MTQLGLVLIKKSISIKKSKLDQKVDFDEKRPIFSQKIDLNQNSNSKNFEFEFRPKNRFLSKSRFQ